MTDLASQVLKHNKESEETLKVKNPVGVFVGSTSGIGRGTAVAFAKHTSNPTIYIVGRNKANAEKVIERLKEVNPNGKYHFEPADLSLVREAARLAQSIKSKETKINVIHLTVNLMDKFGPRYTDENLESKLVSVFYARWKIIMDLLPLLQAAADLKEPSCVNNVYHPGYEGEINTDDLALLKNYKKYGAFTQSVTFMSLMTRRFSTLHPDVGFVHSFPGLVESGVTSQVPWWLKPFTLFINLIAEDCESCGERMHYMHYTATDTQRGSHLLNQSLEELAEKPKTAKYLSKEWEDLVYDHLISEYERLGVQSI